jgi:hypothetical protein
MFVGAPGGTESFPLGIVALTDAVRCGNAAQHEGTVVCALALAANKNQKITRNRFIKPHTSQTKIQLAPCSRPTCGALFPIPTQSGIGHSSTPHLFTQAS